MLKCYEYGYDYLLIFRLIYINTILVVDRQHLLGYNCDNIAILIIYFEVKPQNIALELPAKTDYIGDILDDMEQLVGQFKGKTIVHSDVMSFVK